MTLLLVLIVALWVLRGLAADPSQLTTGSLDYDLAAHTWVMWYADQDPAVANAPFGADFYPLERANLLVARAHEAHHERMAQGAQHVGQVAGVDEGRTAPNPIARPAHEEVEADRAGREDGERRQGVPPADRRGGRRICERPTRSLSIPAQR